MDFSIKTLIENEGIDILMQLVISPNKDFAAGIEALSRGIHPVSGEHISPVILLEAARAEGLEIELEKLMVKKAFETFKPIYDEKPELLLFVNISETVAEEALSSKFIIESIEKLQIPPQNIFFDIIEFEFSKIEIVHAFIEYYRALGFYMCLDDLCRGYSNIDKILYLCPDIVKININALRSMDHLPYSNHFVKLINTITEQMGILIVAKGIEDAKDIDFSFDCGAEFMQGFYISKPQDLTTQSLESIVAEYRTLMDSHQMKDETHKELTRMITARIVQTVMKIKNSLMFVDHKVVLQDGTALFDEFPMVENIWLLDNKGKQQGETLINHKKYNVKNASMFQVYNPGTDFSSKDLFTQLSNTLLEVWVTPLFKSILTNNVCVSCSIKLTESQDEAVLCMNINFDEIASL